MKKLTLILLILLLTSFSFAHDENVSHYVNMENPAGLVNPNENFEYMIVKGDYLWMLADRFYDNPFKWTEIHEANPYIIDPDWIYPNNWLVIPNVFADANGKPMYSGVGGEDVEPETVTEVNIPNEKDDIKSEAEILKTKAEVATLKAKTAKDEADKAQLKAEVAALKAKTAAEKAQAEQNAEAKVLAKEQAETSRLEADKAKAEAEVTALKAKTAKDEADKAEAALAAATATAVVADESLEDEDKDTKKSCVDSYCGKPGWKLGLHAGYPLGSAPEDESLNLGLLLSTPIGVKVGPLRVGLGAGAFTYNFEDIYIGGGVLASLCVNDLLKLDMPLILQLHGAGFYVFGDESGPGFGGLASGNLPLGKSPFSLGIYGGLGKYYPGDSDFNWANVGAVLFYSL